MKTENNFFEEAKEWSCRKMAIVEKYLDGFTKILGNRTSSSLVYIDGFAGRGIYGNDIKGSPVRAAELASGKYSNILQCVFVEKDDDNYNDLKQYTTQYSSCVEIYKGELSEYTDKILSDAGDRAVLVFLDAFGVKGMEWKTVQKFISRKFITDCWLRLDHRTILRLLGYIDSDSKDARGKLDLLIETFGISDLNLLRQLTNAPSPLERIQLVVRLYQSRLKTSMGENGFVGSYPIISLDRQKKYHLMFACKNRKAAVLANDIVNTVEDYLPVKQAEYQEHIRFQKTNQPSLLELTPSMDEIFYYKVNSLKQKILELLHSQSDLLTIHYELINQNPDLFGTFRRKHLTKALCELEKEGFINLNGAPSRETTKVSRI
uniref:Three-Cys-motif partner protein TcmP n=1 Tax=Bellilinea caldifistulae TaxID=360411 RepID=A0A7C4Q1Y3_9CHLR